MTDLVRCDLDDRPWSDRLKPADIQFAKRDVLNGLVVWRLRLVAGDGA